MALTKDILGKEKVIKPRKTIQNTNPYSLPGNPNEGEQNRKMKENYERQNRWANNNPYGPKKKSGEFSGSSSTKKKIAGAFNSQSKTVKKSSGSNLNGSAGISGKSKKKSGEPITHGKSGKYSGGSLSAPRASKSSKKSKKK